MDDAGFRSGLENQELGYSVGIGLGRSFEDREGRAEDDGEKEVREKRGFS